MATRKEHEARAHSALARAEKCEAKARTAPEKSGFFSDSKDEWEARASRARSEAHNEFAKAKRATK